MRDLGLLQVCKAADAPIPNSALEVVLFINATDGKLYCKLSDDSTVKVSDTVIVTP